MQSIFTTIPRRVRQALETPYGSRGGSLVEYALLAALIAIVCLTAVFFLGGETSEEFDSVGSSFAEAT